MKKPRRKDATPCGLEPLIPADLYWELSRLSATPTFCVTNKAVNLLFSDEDGKPLSTDADRVLQNSPDLLFKVVGYLKEPSTLSLSTLKGAVAGCLGIRGWARPDYKVKDKAVGL